MPEDARVGTEIAGYRIQRQIGRGGMSVVYLAEHLRLGRKVALKLLSPELAENEKFRERFLRESQIAASLDHPNIVPIYDADEAEGVLYIAMRYVEGSDLRRLVHEGGPLDTARTSGIVSQIASALDAAHGHGLVHRDVKPGNVLLTPEDHVYVSDFGLTKRALSVSGLTQTGQLVGTIDYVAPEQIKGDPVDGRADVYSLGCIVFECLTGKLAYDRDLEVAILWAHVQEAPPKVSEVRPDLPEELDDVVAHAMAKDPEERAPTAGTVATELRAAIGLEAPAPGVARPKPKRKSGARGQGRIAAVIAAIVVVAAVAGFLILRGGGAGAVVPTANTVARIQADSNTFAEPIKVGQDPIGVALGSGSVWVINQGSQTFSRIDATTGAELDTRSTLGTPTGIAFGADAAWITNGYGSQTGGSQVVTVNPTDNSVRKAFDSPNAKAIVVAFDSIWLADTDRDVVLRYDPRDLTAPPIEIPMDNNPNEASGPSYLAVGTGAASGIWVVNELGDTVVRINPETNKVNPRVQVTQPYGVAAGDSGVWVTSHATDTVTRIDPVTGTTKQTYTLAEDGIPDGPKDIVLAPGGVWLTSDLDREVVRIDPTTNQVADRLKVDGVAEGMAVDANGDVWVTVHAP